MSAHTIANMSPIVDASRHEIRPNGMDIIHGREYESEALKKDTFRMALPRLHVPGMFAHVRFLPQEGCGVGPPSAWKVGPEKRFPTKRLPLFG